MKLSIITINYNHKKGLQKTIDSVLRQSYKDFEWIIIDGGSTDGSKELIKQISENTTYWVSEADNGIYHAMNKGIKKSTGDYLLFLNSGDYLYNDNVIKTFLSTKYKCDILIGQLVKERNNKFIIENGYINNNITFADILLYPVPHQATFINRKLFDKFGLYNEDHRIVSDWEFFIKTIVIENVSIQLLKYPISVFECNGISEKYSRINETERKKVLNNLFPERVLSDYSYAISLKEVYKHNITQYLYKIIYNIAIWLN